MLKNVLSTKDNKNSVAFSIIILFITQLQKITLFSLALRKPVLKVRESMKN